MISLVIVEDINEIRNGLSDFFKFQEDILLLSAHNSIKDFFDNFNQDIEPDIFIMDIGLPGISGIAGIKMIKEKYPSSDFLVLSIYESEDKVFDALCAGATGYLIKNTPLAKIKEAVIELKNGGAPMSPKIARKVIHHFSPKKQKDSYEVKEIVNYLVEGFSYKQISEQLNNSIETIRHHIKNIYRKLHVNSKTEVITKSLKGEI
jgi:DNA-binding NarL/FixJ family response regulator